MPSCFVANRLTRLIGLPRTSYYLNSPNDKSASSKARKACTKSCHQTIVAATHHNGSQKQRPQRRYFHLVSAPSVSCLVPALGLRRTRTIVADLRYYGVQASLVWDKGKVAVVAIAPPIPLLPRRAFFSTAMMEEVTDAASKVPDEGEHNAEEEGPRLSYSDWESHAQSSSPSENCEQILAATQRRTKKHRNNILTRVPFVGKKKEEVMQAEETLTTSDSTLLSSTTANELDDDELKQRARKKKSLSCGELKRSNKGKNPRHSARHLTVASTTALIAVANVNENCQNSPCKLSVPDSGSHENGTASPQTPYDRSTSAIYQTYVL